MAQKKKYAQNHKCASTISSMLFFLCLWDLLIQNISSLNLDALLLKLLLTLLFFCEPALQTSSPAPAARLFGRDFFNNICFLCLLYILEKHFAVGK